MAPRTCHFCKKTRVDHKATICPYCRSKIEPISFWKTGRGIILIILGIFFGVPYITGKYFFKENSIAIEKVPIQKSQFTDPEGNFTFVCQSGTVNAYYKGMKDVENYGRNQYVVNFEPHLKKTDGNLYAASLACVINIFQKIHGQGGLFFLDNAEVKYDEIYKTNVLYWKLPSGKGLYVLSMLDDKDALGAILIYLK